MPLPVHIPAIIELTLVPVRPILEYVGWRRSRSTASLAWWHFSSARCSHREALSWCRSSGRPPRTLGYAYDGAADRVSRPRPPLGSPSSRSNPQPSGNGSRLPDIVRGRCHFCRKRQSHKSLSRRIRGATVRPVSPNSGTGRNLQTDPRSHPVMVTLGQQRRTGRLATAVENGCRSNRSPGLAGTKGLIAAECNRSSVIDHRIIWCVVGGK